VCALITELGNCGSWAKGHCENIKTFYYLCGLIIFFFVLGCAGSCVFCINRGKDTSSSCSADTCTDTCTGASLARLPPSLGGGRRLVTPFVPFAVIIRTDCSGDSSHCYLGRDCAHVLDHFVRYDSPPGDLPSARAG
jgi:hypothetical protein